MTSDDLQIESVGAVTTQQLEDLFRHNLNLANDQRTSTIAHLQHQPSNQGFQEPHVPVKYSISQHYTHTAHVAPSLHPLQPTKADAASHELIRNGISPASLLRAQLCLFEQADKEERSRLIDLWTTVPPNYARNGGQDLADKLGEYQTATLAQEEELARIRIQEKDAAQVQVKALTEMNYPEAYLLRQLLDKSSSDGTQDVEMN